MTETRHFLISHGAPLLFCAVLAEQLGLPLPALPWLLAAGALAAAGSFNLPAGIGLTVLACLIADGIWFYLGRTRGHQVLGLLCRISLEPDSCVKRTENLFTKHGWRGIILAKFVPGLSTVIPPLAGMSEMTAAQFLGVDAVGSGLYGGCFLAVGYFFSSQIQQISGAVASIGTSALCLVVGAVAAYVAFKFWKRKRLLDELRMTRITVADLRRMIKTGDNIVILDMRSNAEYTSNAGIEGAIHLSIEDIQKGRYEIPRDREVVVYCSCPNDVTAARVALLLRRSGFSNVRPLLGGIDAWKQWDVDDASERKAS
jgi:membrane protein DedA with SNARE-associated domain/rhodanese-related sulfurtransferase